MTICSLIPNSTMPAVTNTPSTLSDLPPQQPHQEITSPSTAHIVAALSTSPGGVTAAACNDPRSVTCDSWQNTEELLNNYPEQSPILFMQKGPRALHKPQLLQLALQGTVTKIVFEEPYSGPFFTVEERHLLHDLETLGTEVYWHREGTILRYAERPHYHIGMFVPLDKVEHYRNATLFGVYGSHCSEGNLEGELRKLLEGLKELQNGEHPSPRQQQTLCSGDRWRSWCDGDGQPRRC